MKLLKKIRKTFQVVLLMLLITNVYGQEGNLKITKKEIINKAWEAMFGKFKPDDIKSIYVEGFFHGRDVPTKTTIIRPNLFRNEIASGVLVFDGKQAAWVERKPDEKGNKLYPEMIESEYWRHFEVDIAVIFPAFFDFPCELRGVKKKGERKVYELYVDLPLGSNVSYFVDAETFLVTSRLVSWDGDPKAELWENLITKYIDYKGILFPDGYSFVGNDGKEKGFFKNVKFNFNPDKKLFEIPKGIN
ncbi:hypothetical protein ACFLSY_12245 [Bacteroidota bacterium]